MNRPIEAHGEIVLTQAVEALLFDLGGVLIEIDFDRTFRAWQNLTPLGFAEIKERFYFDEAYEQHERGEIDKADYFAHLRTALHLEGSDEQIAEGWNALFIADIPAVLEAVERVAAHIPCYAFTNTNAEHQRAWSAQFPHVTPLFRRVFSSWQLGLRKPERAAFLSVAQHIGIPCESILFFDDTLENIEHAQRTGLQTVHVRHTADVKSALAQLY